MAAQWVAWRLRLPSILVLLVAGFAVGPGRLGWIDPDQLLGDLLFPVVSASVALILFEGGMSLKASEFKAHGAVVMRLITMGLVVTWVLALLAARYLAGLPWGLATLVGAIVTVSGPTVVQPLLRHIQPRGPAGPILRWEGILVDPIGALAALLAFEALFLHDLGAASTHAALGVARTVLVGGAAGLLGGYALVAALRRWWLPDHLHNPVFLACVVGVFALSNALQHESGLLAATLMGIVVANQRGVSVRHILEFEEDLRVLLLSSLFLLLAARISNADVGRIDLGAVGFVAALVLVVRPASAWLASAGSDLARRDRVLLAAMYPRGIVAAAVASLFGLRLVEAGVPGAERLAPLVFLTIVGTVLAYGLLTAPLARRLGLSTPNPQGILFVGAHKWSREIALGAQRLGIAVLMADTNRENIAEARMAGLPTWHGNVLDEGAHERMDLTGIGRVFALTPNHEVNVLVAEHFRSEFGREHVYRLARDPLGGKQQAAASSAGRILFGDGLDHFALSRRFGRPADVRATPLTAQFDLDAWREMHGERGLPLLAVGPGGAVAVATKEKEFSAPAGWTLLAAVEEEPAAEPAPAPAPAVG